MTQPLFFLANKGMQVHCGWRFLELVLYGPPSAVQVCMIWLQALKLNRVGSPPLFAKLSQEAFVFLFSLLCVPAATRFSPLTNTLPGTAEV